MVVSVPKETVLGEQRVALVPELVPRLTKVGLDVVVQSSAGERAGFFDAAYEAKGARLEEEVFGKAAILLKVQPPTIDEIGRINEDSRLWPRARLRHSPWSSCRASHGPSPWMPSAP
jgi:NAD(P) transhydrogenase subunit alpha